MLPEGGILVFVTGQQEVHTLCQKLRKTFPVEGKVGKDIMMWSLIFYVAQIQQHLFKSTIIIIGILCFYGTEKKT